MATRRDSALPADSNTDGAELQLAGPGQWDVGHRTFVNRPIYNQPAPMPLSSKLDRKLRAAEESSDEEEYYEVTDRSSSASVIEFGDTEEIPSSGDDGEGSEGEEMVRSPLFCSFIG